MICFYMTDKKREGYSLWKDNFVWDIVTAITIITLPITLYTHLLFNNELSGKIIFGAFTFNHNFPSFQSFVWFALSMLIPLLLFIVWFFKSPNAWKYFILSPISLFLLVLIKNGLFHIKSDDTALLFVILFIVLFLFFLIYTDRKSNKRAMMNSQADVTTIENLSRNNRFLYFDLLQYTSHLEKTKKKYSKQNYLEKLYSAQQVLDAELDISIQKVKKQKKNRYVFEIISCFILLFIPSLYFMEMLIPKGVQTYQLGWLEINDFGFNDVNMFFWYVNLKLCVLLPLMIWFVSCRKWWRYSILVPIILTTSQLWELFQSPSASKLDQFELFKALPAILFIIGLLLLSSYFIKYRYRIFDVYLDITHEINDVVGQLSSTNEIVVEKRAILDQLKETSVSEVMAAERMVALLKLKESLIAELGKKKGE